MVQKLIVMANPHHRKAHKSHVQHFKENHLNTNITHQKSSAAAVFSIVVGVVALALSYFAGGDYKWMIVSTVVGLLAGYLVGKRIDKS